MSGSDPHRFTTIAHATHTFLGPLDPASVDALLARIPRAPNRRVLDVGCGKGEIITRALEHLGGTGVGIEPNPAFAADARARAAQRLPHGAISIIESTFAEATLGDDPFDLAICTGSLHAFGDWLTALEGTSRLVRAEGWAVLAPSYWKQLPSPAYLATLGGHEGEVQSLLATTMTAKSQGWHLLACHESTVTEWDAYEHAYAANVRAWCSANPGDLDAEHFSERIEKWAAAYAKWGRGTMGYALMLLRRERESESAGAGAGGT